MKLDRVEFIKSLEAKEQAFMELKEARDEQRRVLRESYELQVQEYRKKVSQLLASGIEYSVNHRYDYELTVAFPKGTALPTPPSKPDYDNRFDDKFWKEEAAHNNRAKLLSTLNLSTETEITLTKQILDLL